MLADIRIYCRPELKELAGKAADSANVALSEWAAKVLAKELSRPDLGSIPRKRAGRPRKTISA